MFNSSSSDDEVDLPVFGRRKSIRDRRNSIVNQIYVFQYSMIYDVNDNVINTVSSLLSSSDDEYCSVDANDAKISLDDDLEQECFDDNYAIMKATDDSTLKYFEINQSIKLLTDLDYVVPSFNPNLIPLYDCRNNLTLNPLVTVSSEIDANMYEYLKLKEESMHAGGVEIIVAKMDLLNMRLFRFDDFFWIVKCPEKTSNRKLFHFGDKIISINGEQLPDFNRFKEILAATFIRNKLKFRIQRLPRAKIFGVKAENYKSIFHLDEQNQFIVLNHMKDDENNKWLITEIDGEHIDYIYNQNKLEEVFDKQHNPYVTMVMHSVNFLKTDIKRMYKFIE